MKGKKFIRFVCNTKDHPRGEKIKMRSMITKIYNDKNEFLYIKKPYIKALENQIEIDIDFIVDGIRVDPNQYIPLYHFKHDKGKIVKKSDAEIQIIEAERTASEAQKVLVQQQKDDEINIAKQIILNADKTDKEKLDALISIMKNKGAI